jgi:hypothetical protein
VALLGVLAFIPYYPDGVTPTTLPAVLLGHIGTPRPKSRLCLVGSHRLVCPLQPDFRDLVVR